MKRLATFALAALIVCGSAVPASAIDVNVAGEWEFAWGYAHNKAFTGSAHGNAGDSDHDKSFARQRVRTQIDFVASESLKAVLAFELGTWDWGGTGGAQLDTDGVNVETRRAYLDWVIPGTSISTRMGLQNIAQPSTPMGATVFDMDVAGIVISSPVAGPLSATAFWARPFDQSPQGRQSSVKDDMDVFGLMLPVTGDSWSITPWGVYATIGSGSGYYDYLLNGEYENSNTTKNSSANAYWLGLHSEFSPIDNLTVNLEGIYGHLGRARLGDAAYNTDYSTSGWFAALTIDYNLDWATPGFFGWYSSGDSDDNLTHSRHFGRMPILGTDGGSFGPTSFGTAGTVGVGNDCAITASGLGTWGIGIQLAGVTFVEDLSHTLRFAYYRGTNDSDIVKDQHWAMPYDADAFYMTDKDWAFEVNFDHSYTVNDNLSFMLEMGYIHLKADKNVWYGFQNEGRNKNDNAYKIELNMLYEF